MVTNSALKDMHRCLKSIKWKINQNCWRSQKTDFNFRKKKKPKMLAWFKEWNIHLFEPRIFNIENRLDNLEKTLTTFLQKII
ncbi:hypothetical protein [Mycoplasmoides pirum]|uniref:hypothetical protein n=1 Tax=Mycoplasmoides pirum TaxID=2122 RepID=UPI000488D9E7|nr:hypothetical protein [Mycoplasmoides pirum]